MQIVHNVPFSSATHDVERFRIDIKKRRNTPDLFFLRFIIIIISARQTSKLVVQSAVKDMSKCESLAHTILQPSYHVLLFHTYIQKFKLGLQLRKQDKLLSKVNLVCWTRRGCWRRDGGRRMRWLPLNWKHVSQNSPGRSFATRLPNGTRN